MKLTAKTIATLKLREGQSECEIYDEALRGFGIRIREGGSRNFIFRYCNPSGKIQRMTIGPATAETAGPAREQAAKYALEVAAGKDPAQDKKDAKETAKQDAEHTFGVQVERYLKARESEFKPHSFADVVRHLTGHAAALHKLPIKSVTQLNVASLLSKVEAERGPVSANRVRTSLSAFFNWVLSEGVRLPEGNPVTHTRKREEKSRDRVLTHDELKRVWSACEDDHFGAIVKLLMLTAQRREEIAGLRCAEVNDDKAQIELPKERTKNAREHVVPLSDTAKAILNRIPRADRVFVFGRDDTGYSGFTRSKDRLDKRLGEIAHWTVHDLRRTAATLMAGELGVQPHIIEAVINHVSGHKAGVAGIYNRATYEKEKRIALDSWAEHLTAIVEGRTAKVVAFKRGA
jgi:integrase